MDFKALGDHLGLEEDEYLELIELFVESGGADFEKLLEALAARNADQVMRRAHTIKGASGNLGLTDVSAAARIIEEHAMNNRLGDVDEAVRNLKDHLQEIKARMN